jgi:antitoxin component of MazEF toxin-antitoxin module
MEDNKDLYAKICSENDTVDVILEKDKIVISKRNTKEHKITKERLLKFYGTEKNTKYTPQKEIDWGSPGGKEIWTDTSANPLT